MRTRTISAAIFTATLLAGCQDLDIVNTNAPDRRRALSSPSDVETLVASTWRDIWNRTQNGSATYNAMPVLADVFTATYANDAALELSSEPRPPLNNNPLSDAHAVPNFPWGTFYKAISSANDGIIAMNDGLEIITGATPADNTTRAMGFALWARAASHVWLAALFDKNFIVRETANLEEPLENPLVEYPASMDSALKLVDEAITYLNANAFTVDPLWINGTEFTNQDLARILASWTARLYVAAARTPEERQALDWDLLLSYVDKGITTDFAVLLQSGVLTSGYLSRLQQNGTFSAWGDYKFIGQADVSGNFKNWLALPEPQRERFQITTPDRRITGTTPTSDGAYYRYRADNIFRPERGTYHHSHYQWRRNGGRSVSQNYTIMSVAEMNLLRAEAYYYKGDLDRAAQFVNTTRAKTVRIGNTDHPGLPEVTADGVPQAADCVPRPDGERCGTLLEALMYERILETQAMDALLPWMESRGWGRLSPGTFIHLPIPARELETLGLPVYSFGGVGGPGAAR